MKKISLFMAALAVSAMAMAADAIVSSTFTSKDWTVGAGEQEWVAAGAEATTIETSGSARGVQVTLAKIKDDGLTLTNDSISKIGQGIKKVNIVYSSNCAGASDGTIAVKVGATAFGGAFTIQSETNATISFENSTAVKGDIVITFTSTATKKSIYIKSISVTYEKNKATEPTISANTLDFGAYVIGVSEAKELVVEGENLTDAISYAWQTGGLFSAAGTLTAEGGTLDIDVMATTDTEAIDSLVLTSGTAVTKVAVKANVIATVGTGTEADPFTAADVRKMNNALKDSAWVVGYIAGCAENGGKITSKYTATSLALVDAMTDTVCAPVKISGDAQEKLNLKDNSAMLGAKVKVFGKLAAGYGVAGVEGVKDKYEVISTPTRIKEVAEKKQVRKTMINGQMVIIRDGKMFNALGAEL